MTRYLVTVTTPIYVSGTITVEADSPEAARARVDAILQSNRHDDTFTDQEHQALDSIYGQMRDMMADLSGNDLDGDWTTDGPGETEEEIGETLDDVDLTQEVTA